MKDEKTSILLSDISIEGDLIEKEKVILDAKVSGDIKAEEIQTHQNSNIKGNINSKLATLGGTIKGNVNSDKIRMSFGGSADSSSPAAKFMESEEQGGGG